MALGLHPDGESGSPPPVELRWPRLRSPPPPPSSEREVCAGAPAAPAAGASPPRPGAAVTAVVPSGRFGGLLGEQSGTVSLGFHHSARSACCLTSPLPVQLRLDVKQRAAASGPDLVDSDFPFRAAGFL